MYNILMNICMYVYMRICMVVAFVDLRKAFDTVDHELLI